ncbi:Gasdermin-D [Varanus komodoensis]|nr:Gasdermin-D [Varanus komodoensis]
MNVDLGQGQVEVNFNPEASVSQAPLHHGRERLLFIRLRSQWGNMFKRLAKQLIQELDSDQKLIPMTSLRHSESFQPLSLVTKEQSKLPWRTPRYSPTSFKLADVLQDGAAMEIELKHSEPLLFSTNTSHKSGASMALTVKSTEVDIGGLAGGCLSASPLYVKKTYVDTRDLWTNEMPLSIPPHVSPKLPLYVVTEVFKITKSLLIEETVQLGGKGQVSVSSIFKIKGLNMRVRKKSMLVPEGTVIAYAVEKLPTEEKDQALQDDLGYSVTGNSTSSVGEARMTMRSVYFLKCARNAGANNLCQQPLAVQQVKDAIQKVYDPLMDLSQALKRHLLEPFGVVLQDRDVVCTVQLVLELSMAGESIDRSMLESLDEEFQPLVEMLLSLLGIFQVTGREEHQALWGSMYFLCSSLEELDYKMLPLLEAILEKKDIAKQLEMMNGILEWILSGDEGSHFTIPSDSRTDEEDDLTKELLQTCGLDLETGKDSITCLWNKDAFSGLAALYSSLYALWVLSG